MGILGHDFSGHYNRLALISVDIMYRYKWSLLYFETFPHNNNCYQALACADDAGKHGFDPQSQTRPVPISESCQRT